MWHSVHGDESSYLRESDIEVDMAKSGGSPGLSAMSASDLQKGSSSGLRKSRKDTRRLTCGSGNVGDGTCANEGECCSQYGWCGTSAEHCGGSPGPGPTPGGGTCGSGNVGDGTCANAGECCSQYGWCGTSAEHCGGSPGPGPTGEDTSGSSEGPLTGLCDSNGGSCGCGTDGSGRDITLNRFFGDWNDETVFGCGGAFALSGAELGAQWETTFSEGGPEASTGASLGLSFSQGESWNGWEGCCYVCGVNLQMAGKLSSGWYCEKDFFSTGIWLKGVNA